MHRALSPAAVLAALLALSFAAAACSRIARPDGWTAPLEAGDLLIAGRDDRLVALNEDGSAAWVFPAKDQRKDVKLVALYGNTALDESADYVYVPAYNEAVYRLRVEDGAIDGLFKTKGEVVGGVAVKGDEVYFGDGSGRVYALTADLSEQRWVFDAGDRVWATPVITSDTVIVASLEGRLYALERRDGRERWRFDAGAGIAGTPALSGSTLYVPALDSKLYALDVANGGVLWSFSAGNWFWGTPVVESGTVYAGSLDGRVYALDAATGAEKWRYHAGAPVRSSPLLTPDALVVASRAGRVAVLDPQTGAEVRTPVELGERVLADLAFTAEGQVLIATTENRLVTFDPADGSQQAVGLPKEVGTPVAVAEPTPTGGSD